jgi:hypothetical protein
MVAALVRQGFSEEIYLGPGRDPAPVHATFTALGLDPPDDLVSLFTWRTVVHPSGYAPIFREVFLHPLATMVDVYRFNRQIAAGVGEHGLDPTTVWPGPSTWFPALMMDGAEIIAVDCGYGDRGAVWFAFTQSEPARMYQSLAEAIAAALHCIEAGYWHYDPASDLVEGDGRSPAWLGDPVAAPWRITA